MVDVEKLKQAIQNITPKGDIPEGEFCCDDLVKSGLRKHQASKFLHDLATRDKDEYPRIEFVTKRTGVKINGDIKQVPYYRYIESGS